MKIFNLTEHHFMPDWEIDRLVKQAVDRYCELGGRNYRKYEAEMSYAVTGISSAFAYHVPDMSDVEYLGWDEVIVPKEPSLKKLIHEMEQRYVFFMNEGMEEVLRKEGNYCIVPVWPPEPAVTEMPVEIKPRTIRCWEIE